VGRMKLSMVCVDVLGLWLSSSTGGQSERRGPSWRRLRSFQSGGACQPPVGRSRPRARWSTLASTVGIRFGPAISATIRAASTISRPPAAVT